MDPKNLLFTESHEWVEASGAVRRMGITDHAQHLLGDIVFIELPAPGRKVAKGEEVLVVESPKAAASVYAPLSGEIVEVNGSLESSPETINRSPYGDGWLLAIRPDDAAGAAGLMDHDTYEKKINEA